MLKIKDDVDLKELEKFGFVHKKETNESSELYRWEIKTSSIFDAVTVFVWSREVSDTGATDKLYDLIQAGLVEKV